MPKPLRCRDMLKRLRRVDKEFTVWVDRGKGSHRMVVLGQKHYPFPCHDDGTESSHGCDTPSWFASRQRAKQRPHRIGGIDLAVAVVVEHRQRAIAVARLAIRLGRRVAARQDGTKRAAACPDALRPR